MEELLAKYAKIPERIRYPVGAAVIIALIAAHVLVVHSVQEGMLSTVEERLHKLQQERTEKRAYADNLPRYEARFSELQQALTTARTLLPDNADVPQFLAQLGNSGRDVGMVIERFEPHEEVYQDFYAEIGFGLQVHGTYHEIAMFIDSVGKLDRIVNVSDISMTDPKVESQKVVLRGSFAVKTFRFITDEQAAEIMKKKEKKK